MAVEEGRLVLLLLHLAPPPGGLIKAEQAE
jgi:hypothetical protein